MTVHYLPPRRTADLEALMRVAGWYERALHWPGWERFLLGECAAFHFVCAVVLAGLGRAWWAAAFAAAGAAALLLLRRVTVLTQLMTWYLVFPLGFTWALPLIFGLVQTAPVVMVLAWPFLYLPWAVVALRLTGKR